MIKICFDVDGTLIIDEKQQELFDSPNYKVIALYKLLESFGCEIYIWSGGGISYATRWAMKLGLKGKVVRKGSFVPDITIDDEDITLGKVNIKV